MILWKEIILHFFGITGKYVENKPIHETQKHKWIDDETLEVRFKVIPNYELERLILSYGPSVKIIQPDFLVNNMTISYNKSIENYI